MQNLVKVFSLLSIISLICTAAGSTAEAPKKVAILPFQINAAQDLSYLRNGIQDMLASRLAWEARVEIIEKQEVARAMATREGPLNEVAAREVGNLVAADYALFGSLTVFGESVSIDAKMLSLTAEKPPVTVYTQTKGMDEVIPRINDFAQEINARIFGRQPTALAAAPQPRFSQANPETLVIPGGGIPGGAVPGGAIPAPAEGQGRSDLNPSFVVPQTVSQTGAFWQSQQLDLAITSMEVADVNGDGILEILLLGRQELHIYQQAGNSLHLLKVHKGEVDDHFIWVSAADLNNDQIPEIYVGNRRRAELLSSFVLEWNGVDWLKSAEGIRWHLRTFQLPEQGPVLLGQAGVSDEPFKGRVYVLSKAAGDYEPLTPVNLPSGTSIYSFNLADLTQDGDSEVLRVTQKGNFQVQTRSGEILWDSEDRFAASFAYLEGEQRDETLRGTVPTRVKTYLNAPLLVADLNGDGVAEVIINKNISGLLGRKFIDINFFGKSELHSFSWDGLTMVENWHTPPFQGMTTAYEVADLDGNGSSEILVVLVKSPGTAIWEKAKSIVVVYPIAMPGGQQGQGA